MTPSASGSAPVLAARGLSRRYRRRGPDALSDCTFRLPAGVICALVGPNGSGKSTLLDTVAGLDRPSAGSLEVLGGPPRAGHPRISHLAQGRPLFPWLTVRETLRYGARANQGGWNAELAERVVAAGGFGAGTRIRELSGGQRTRVALALALGKRADLLLLDEPMADLDVLARQELMGLLMADVAENGSTVVMSSHIITELADVCDHLLLLDRGRARVCGDIDELTAAHAVVTVAGGAEQLSGHTVVESRAAGRGTSALLRPSAPLPEAWEPRTPSLEELVLAYLSAPQALDLDLSQPQSAEETAA
ncbi:ABC transporter ATP-binding protein [Phaeacidiphilus oryzae]|uniref:ABC transporter ATP-binding protein n=1 Tax=Phaeacidiphilus oryzae TaxID=348818 RepID=UPI00055B999B|nr:ABC transporter ATP-binding protein [Phaeacidiphilus oryzae]